jgi:hypothetical protein
LFWGEVMATKGGRKTCRGCQRWEEMKSKMRIAELLEKAADSFVGAKPNGEFKPTLAEYLKLVQLEREFEEEDLREVKVTWVDPSEAGPRK